MFYTPETTSGEDCLGILFTPGGHKSKRNRIDAVAKIFIG